MKKLLTILLAVFIVLGLSACTKTDSNNSATDPEIKEVDPNEKSEGSMTYAEFKAASEEYADVTIEGFITNASYSKDYGNINLFVQDGDGGYFVYRMPCDDTAAGELVVGQKVIITGQKAAWAGEPEIAEGTGTYTLVDAKYEFESKDLTDKFGDSDALYEAVNTKVAFKGLTVVGAPQYNWDGSGSEGDDVYFTVTDGTTNQTVLVESSEFGADTDVYKAAVALTDGAKIDVEGFLYWYEGPQAHISNITTK